MNIYAIASLVAFIICFSLSLFIVVKGKKNMQNMLFSLSTFLTGIWCLFPFLNAIVVNEQRALFYTRLVYIFAAFVPATWLHFMFSLIGKEKSKLKLIAATYLISFLWSLLAFNPFFIRGTVRFAPYFYLKPGPLYIYFFLFFGITMCIILINLFQSFHQVISYKKNQLKYILVASIISITAGAMHFLSAYLHVEPFPHDLLISIFPCIIAYAIIKYRLMDIVVAITRTTIFVVLFSIVLGLPFLFAGWGKEWLTNLLGANWWLGPMMLLAALGTSGPFLFFYLEKRTLAILLREQHRYQEALKHAAVDMTRIRNPQKLLDFIAHLFIEAVRISHVLIYLIDQKTELFMLRGGLNQKNEQPVTIDKKNILISRLEDTKESLIYEEVKRESEDDSSHIFKEMETEMRSLNAAVVVPCFLEGKLLDIIILGDKLSGGIYTSEDLQNFSVLADEVALATENALLYGNIEEEVRQRTEQLVGMQKQLIQAEKLATVGILAGGVAHEINNPLTAILTNVQMLLASDSVDDKLDKESLELIEEATKRCRTIVQKLMAYAKKPLETAKISKVNLLNVLKNVASFLDYQLKQENIKIVIDVKEDEYLVMGNQNELEQVVTNIILNAKDAIKQIKKGGDIHISLAKSNDSIKIKIEDEGIGIPKDIMPRIFDPFFTTKEVGKGVGLGLSICQSIAEKHNGLITVQSEPNKGSTFTVQLPKVKSNE